VWSFQILHLRTAYTPFAYCFLRYFNIKPMISHGLSMSYLLQYRIKTNSFICYLCKINALNFEMDCKRLFFFCFVSFILLYCFEFTTIIFDMEINNQLYCQSSHYLTRIEEFAFVSNIKPKSQKKNFLFNIILFVFLAIR
jgi:hypothetical protein